MKHRRATRFLKGAVSKIFGLAGYRIEKASSTHPTSFTSALGRLRRRDAGMFQTVIDIGASDGIWTRQVMEFFPDADYLLIDANPTHEAALTAFCAEHRNARYTLAAAGAEKGTLYFDASDPLGGLASYTPLENECIEVPVVSVDGQVDLHGLRPPFLVKLDTHGFELPILKGAEQTLKLANVLILECYNFKIAPDCLLFHEMCKHLDGYGFRLMDLYDIMHRPSDGVFWQMDMLFTRSDRREFDSAKYA